MPRKNLSSLVFLAVSASLLFFACKKSENASDVQMESRPCSSRSNCAREAAELREHLPFARESERIICGHFGGSFSDMFKGNWVNLQSLIGLSSTPRSVAGEVGKRSAAATGALASLAMKTPCQIAQLYTAAVEAAIANVESEEAAHLSAQVARDMCARMRRAGGMSLPADCSRFR